MQPTPPTIAETYTAKPPEDRKRRPNWKALLFIVIFFLLVLVAGFLQSPLSAVSRIDVTGNNLVRYEAILTTSGVEKGMSFWKIDTDRAEEAILTAFPLVESVNIQVTWTGEVTIALAEKVLAGTLVNGTSFCTVLSDGTVLACGAKPENDTVPLISMDNLPAIEPGRKAPSPDLLELVKQVPEVERTVLDTISEIRVTAEGPWRIFMRDKFEARIPPRLFADKMKGYLKFRNALDASKPPGIINLLESNYYEAYKGGGEPAGKEESE